MLAALLIAVVAIGLAWHVGLNRHSELVGSSVDATELWRNPWPAPGTRD
jgi:hypothetical protein